MNITPYFVMWTPTGAAPSDRVAAFAIRSGMTALYRAHGLLVLANATSAHVTLPAHNGVILGHLFSSISGRRLHAATRDVPDVITAEDFVARYWGGYLAVTVQGDEIDVWRDPSGEIPCYHAVIDGTHIFTSQPARLFDAKLLTPEIDWTIVAQSLAFRDFRPARTALRGVSEVMPGIALTLGRGGVATRSIWSPWAFASTGLQLNDLAAAVNELRETTERCIAAWASCFEQPLLEMSGGLDSAIVAVGLAGTKSRCITFGQTAGDPDELPFAKAIAGRLGFELEIACLDALNVDLSRSDAADLPRPCARGFSQALDRPIRDFGKTVQADAFFVGAGGDGIFCHLQSALPIVDRYHQEGFGRGVWQSVNEVTRLAGVTVWQTMATAFRRARRPLQPLPSLNRNIFLCQNAVADLPWPHGNPWSEAPMSIPPGKRTHVWSHVGIYNYMEGYGRLSHAPIIWPLMSQPIVELCLRIPTWLWCAGGNNRAVARAAFADRLPAPVIARRTKGAFDGFGADLVEANRPLLRAMLLDGALSREKLIDRAAVERCLSRPLPDGETVVQLLALADVEAWAQAWETRSTLT